MPGRLRPTIALVLVSMGALGACATGQRPTLVAPPSTVGDPAVGAVLDRLALADSATFTATYDITPTLTGVATQATVIQSGLRRRTTIGTVEYFKDGTVARTCAAGNSGCVDGIDESRVSDLNITQVFWGSSASSRLALDAGRAVGGSAGGTDTIAGQSATCADVTVPAPEGSGVVVYCAIDAGPLGRYRGADVGIELTSFTPVVDETLLGG